VIVWVILVAVAFCAGVAVGATATRRGVSIPGVSQPKLGAPHKELWFARPVWFPWKGEWKRGRITGPAEPTRRYYEVRCYDTGVPVNRELRVAHLDLRVDTGEPLSEMCPPMSIVELEAEMGRPS
jgi:hypothetical protein